MIEQHIYNMNENIKSIVISIQQYRVMREIMPHMMYRFNITKDQKIDIEKQAEYQTKRELLEGLEQFIHCEMDRDRNILEAQIWMPYVKDAIVKSLEETEKQQTRIIGELQRQNREQAQRIDYLELPWWKKLWLKFNETP